MARARPEGYLLIYVLGGSGTVTIKNRRRVRSKNDASHSRRSPPGEQFTALVKCSG